jgi:hypothetical protein
VPSARARVIALGLVAALAVLAAPPASADRAFTPRFSVNDSGDIVMAANTLLSCPSGASGCAQARAGTPGAVLNDNGWDMQFVDVDSDPGTFNSSSAAVSLPADATILFAGLYWGANTTRGADGQPAPNPGARNTVLLATPTSGGYASVRADTVDESETGAQIGGYQGFADVTELVSAGGAGNYTTANVQAGRGHNRLAGWALVIAYHSPAASPRNLTVFDGFEVVAHGTPPHEISVSGFRTPPLGPVRSTLGIVAYEGDLGQGGDSALLNGTKLTDSVPGSADNFFNSSISRLGEPVDSKSPNYSNQLGFDADTVDGTGRLANGTPSGTAIVNQARVNFLAETLGFPVEKATNETRLTTSAPDLAMNKSFGIVAPGTFAFTVTNVGDAPSRGPVVVSDGLEQLLPGSTIAVLDDGGFTCEPLTTSLRCGRSDSLAPGQSWVITAVISGVLPAFTWAE